MSIAEIEHAASELCVLEQPAVAKRFAAHPDASKSSNFCVRARAAARTRAATREPAGGDLL